MSGWLCSVGVNLVFAGAILKFDLTPGLRRWHNQLNPEVSKLPFSEWEQAVIVRVSVRSVVLGDLRRWLCTH